MSCSKSCRNLKKKESFFREISFKAKRMMNRLKMIILTQILKMMKMRMIKYQLQKMKYLMKSNFPFTSSKSLSKKVKNELRIFSRNLGLRRIYRKRKILKRVSNKL
jgi:hypothetical protein